MDSDTFRKFGHQLVDWVADYFAGVEQYPVRSMVAPGDIKDMLPASPPDVGQDMQQIMDDFQRIIVPGMTHWQHPSWFGYFPANNSPPSVLAEILTAGLGAQCMLWQTSPAATELEEVVLEWLRQMLGLPQGMVGVIHDTASTANLCALVAAREAASQFVTNQRGVRIPLVVYASEETHSSIEKGAAIAGYGREFIRFIPTDEQYAMRPDALAKAIRQDEAAGLIPACVVATVGTTSSGSVDPITAIGDICRQRGVWLHVDAAFAGAAAVLPEKRKVLAGLELAQSFVVDPHKWLLTNLDCSAMYVADPQALIKTFAVDPEYLRTGVDGKVKNFRDWGIPLARRFRALKLWFVMRSYGVQGLQDLVREHLRLAQIVRGWVEADDMFELMAPVEFSLICFRLNDGRRSEHELDGMNERLLAAINATGKLFMSHTALRGQRVLRFVVGQRTTTQQHVAAAWAEIRRQAQAIVDTHG